MRRHATIAFVAFLGIVRAGSTVDAQIIVTDWSLLTAVQYVSGGGGQDTNQFITVLNPFSGAHSASLGPGTATTSYNISWSGDNAYFQIDASHVTPDLGGVFYVSESIGNILFTTTTPLIAHLTGSYSYSLPFGGADVITNWRIRDRDALIDRLSDVHQADTIVSPPPANGTFVSDTTALIPANCNCLLQYGIELRAGGNSGELETGAGSFTLTFQPVPEPAMLWLVATAVVWTRRRRG